MSTLKTNNIEHLDASTPSIQTTIGGGTILAGVTTVSDALSVGTGTSITVGSSEAYATPMAFRKKGKKAKNRGLEQAKRLGYIPVKK